LLCTSTSRRGTEGALMPPSVGFVRPCCRLPPPLGVSCQRRGRESGRVRRKRWAFGCGFWLFWLLAVCTLRFTLLCSRPPHPLSSCCCAPRSLETSHSLYMQVLVPYPVMLSLQRRRYRVTFAHSPHPSRLGILSFLPNSRPGSSG